MFKYIITTILVIIVGALGITLLYDFVNSGYVYLVVPVFITALAALCFGYLVFRIVDKLVK